jgi:alanyl-tRNA synthetase
LQEHEGFQFLCVESDLDAKSIKDGLFQLKGEQPRLAAMVATSNGGKPQIAIAFGDALLAEGEWHAGKMVKELAAAINGGGGGQAAFAMAGGKNPAGIPAALHQFEQKIKNPS